jgi:hypothetical protein
VFAHAVNRYVFAPISFHPCVKLGPEQSWHHFKIKKWPITNYVQTQFSVISSNISMIVMYYEYMTTQYFVRFFFWAMSGPFSRFLVIFYPLSPRTPFKNVCHHTFISVNNRGRATKSWK